MKIVISLFCSFLLLLSCNFKKESKPVKEELVMYQPSEMTILMRDMFTFQETSKAQIEKGAIPLKFPEVFKKIHSTELSDQFEHDASFKDFTDLYYTNISNLDNSTTKNAKQNFNIAIQSCIACHQTTCTGPITRIKKLIIK